MRRMLRSVFPGTTGPTAAQLKKELVALSEWWSPYDPALVTNYYVAFRNSPRELYAELLSVLLNAPGEVEARAPLAYRAFLENLDKHPEFRDAWLTLEDVLAGTPEAIAAVRRADVREAYARGEDAWKARQQERLTNRTSIVGVVKQLLFDRAEPALRLQRSAEKKLGKPLPDEQNAKYAMGDLAYSDNTTHLMLRRVQRDVVEPAVRAGLTLEDLGEFLQLHRSKTERANLANPQGHNPVTAQAMLDDLERDVGPVRWATLEASVKKFHDIIFEAVERAVDVGTYNAKTFATQLEPNRENYATFAVVDYLKDHIPAAIIQQVGTFKDVANPFVATVMKTMSLNRVNDLQEAKNTVLKMLTTHFPADVAKHEARRGPGGMRMDPPAPPAGRAWLPVLEDGKLEHYAVDPYIAKMFQSHDVGLLATVGRWMQNLTYKPFHPLYVTFNTAWAMALIPSDAGRMYRNLAIKGHAGTVRDILRHYWKALPVAWRRVRRLDDAQVEEMLKAKALDVPWQDWRFDETHDTYTRMLDRYGLGEGRKWGGPLGAAASAAAAVLHAAEAVGTFIVSVPKIASWNLLQEKGIAGGELSYRVRNFMGHPDRKRKGLAGGLTNGVMMYSNILTQFLRADYEAAVQDPKTRAGWWFRMSLKTLLPRALMAAAAAGLLGAGVKQIMDLIPDHDKTKGTVVPLGLTDGPDGGKKAVYFFLPEDPASMLLGGLLWSLLHSKGDDGKGAMGKVQDVLDVAYSDAPHLSPTLQMAWNWLSYMRGENPYDDFRRREIIDRDDFAAGGWPAFRDMMRWQLNQFGVLSILGHKAIGKDLGQKESTVEAVVGSIPGVSRFVKISDRGVREQQQVEAELKDAEAARFRLSLPDDVRALVRERYRLSLVDKEKLPAKDQDRRAELNRWYDRVYLRLTKAIKQAKAEGDAKAEADARKDLEDATRDLAPLARR
jgi:hypothetical protein